MDKTKAAQIMAAIYNAVKLIPAYDEQSTFAKAGVFQALNELNAVVNEEGGDTTDNAGTP